MSSKWYGTFQVLHDVSLTVGKGERVVVCGPSGSGKSTLIRCINRLEAHQSGQILVNGLEMTDNVKSIDKIRRKHRHGVPELQPVPASDRAGEPDPRADADGGT